MARTENVELAVLCLLHKDDHYLLQNRVKQEWHGYALPGGHIEKDESVVDAVVREIKEETGLTVLNPRLCGIKQFTIPNGRYMVFLFESQSFLGELTSSEEGQMHWVHKEALCNLDTVNDLAELIQVMLDDSLTEFIYDKDDNVILK